RRQLVTLDHDHGNAGLGHAQGRTQAGSAGADDHNASIFELPPFSGFDRRRRTHAEAISWATCATVEIAATGRKPSIAAWWTSGENAAHPPSRTVSSTSRTCASRTVEATPPLVTIPPIQMCSTAILRKIHSSRVM